FPSFHATVAILTPLTLRRHHRIFIVLLVLDAGMLGGTLTEGAHYYVDILAGTGMAFFAHAIARLLVRAAVAERATVEPVAPAAGSAAYAAGRLLAQPKQSPEPTARWRALCGPATHPPCARINFSLMRKRPGAAKQGSRFFAVVLISCCRRLSMDAIDRKILTVLQEDCSLSVAEIGARV